MADIRIKDLTTTASSTASGDFFVIDGTTGTRKVNAFNPSFGGNATVTGTLTVNGAGGSIGGQWKITNATIPDVWLQNTSGATSAYRNILIRQNSDDTFKFLSTSDAGVLSKDNILTGSNANGAIGIGVTPAAGASSLTVAGVIKTNDTTASTSTSSGALVVSGGVGVAGAIYAGGNIVNTGVLSATSSATTLTNVLSNTLTAATNVLNLQLRRGDSANGFARLMLNTSTTTEWSFGTRAADTNLYIWDEVANAARLTVASSDGLATFGAAIRTSAPSGGTAANWKLGTVATVSPTSPNRTIEVDIGGTIYYIHAKTTNN